MKILTINAGSSSIKYRIFDMHDEQMLAYGKLERIGDAASQLTHQWINSQGHQQQIISNDKAADHHTAMANIIATINNSKTPLNLDEISGIGHRVVHGGEAFQRPTTIDSTVIDTIKKLIPLAPLHNPANLTGIQVCRDLFPDIKQIAVFDTAFHQSLPEFAYRYALPEELYIQYHVRRYGFHGTSHAFVAKQAARILGQPLESLNLITLHLGNGASAAAVKKGRSVDTSMGLTPLEGLVMGTRCGDIDPAISFYLSEMTGKSPAQIDNLYNKQSGLKGLCGANDMREILKQIDDGNETARLALEIYTQRIKKYIGMYYAVLGKVDALVFTAGIGENAAIVREKACSGLEDLGISINLEKNNAVDKQNCQIQNQQAKVKILVIHTNEGLEIARQTAQMIKSKEPKN